MSLTPERRSAALVAGWSLLAMAVLAGFANFGVLERLGDDPSAVSAAVAASPGRIRAAALALLGVAVLDVVVAWALRTFFAPSGRDLASLAAWLRVAYAAAFVAGTAHLVTAARVSGPPGTAAAAEVGRYHDVWSLALGLFGLHLVVVSVLAARTPGAPRLLAPLLLLAGAGYLVDTVAAVAVPAAGLSVSSVTFVGEVVLLGWLLWVARRPAAPQQSDEQPDVRSAAGVSRARRG